MEKKKKDTILGQFWEVNFFLLFVKTLITLQQEYTHLWQDWPHFGQSAFYLIMSFRCMPDLYTNTRQLCNWLLLIFTYLHKCTFFLLSWGLEWKFWIPSLSCFYLLLFSLFFVFFPSFCCFVLSIFSLRGITQLCHCNIALNRITLTEKSLLFVTCGNNLPSLPSLWSQLALKLTSSNSILTSSSFSTAQIRNSLFSSLSQLF